MFFRGSIDDGQTGDFAERTMTREKSPRGERNEGRKKARTKRTGLYDDGGVAALENWRKKSRVFKGRLVGVEDASNESLRDSV